MEINKILMKGTNENDWYFFMKKFSTQISHIYICEILKNAENFFGEYC